MLVDQHLGTDLSKVDKNIVGTLSVPPSSSQPTAFSENPIVSLTILQHRTHLAIVFTVLVGAVRAPEVFRAVLDLA